jgi:glycosyltransferase involved in cell wall biosynthesis
LFRKEAWEKSDGYPSGVGYEDWAFWLHAAELGYWSKLIPEPLFLYRTAIRSRFTDERKKHQDNIVAVQSRYPQYVQKIQKFLTRRGNHYLVAQSTADTAFVNLDRADQYRVPANGLPHILIVIPWMTFGGAEALILSFTRALKDKYNITFMTWLQSDHQWEKRFAVVSPRIYHLANLFDSNGQMEAFVLNFIKTRGVDVVHLIHTNFMFGRLRQMKALPTAPKIIVTLFNDRVKEYFEGSIEEHSSIDVYSTDNLSTAEHFRRKLPKSSTIAVIPNGIDTVDTFNNVLYDSSRLKKKFNIGADDIVVSFIGRLSPEKNPDTFLSAAIKLAKTHDRLHFLVLGDGVMSDKIAKLASDAGDDRIHILGYQSNTAKYLNISDIFVLPSMIEGFPISVLEAMSMGVAPIGADVGAMREIITHKKDGYIIEDGAEDNIVSAIEKLLRSPRLLASMRREAYATAHKRFTLRVLSDNYDNLYKDALR